MAKKRSYSLNFVPQSTGKGPDDRKFINSHLSRLAIEQRRAGKSSVKSLVTSPSQGAKVQIPRRGSAQEYSEHPSPEDSQAKSLTLEPQLQDDVIEDIRGPPGLFTAPYTLLDDGRPDPFASTLIPLTRPVQALLAFNQNLFLPWTSRTEREGEKTVALPKRFFWKSTEAAIEGTVGYAHLARLGAVAATITSDPRLARAALEYSSRAYQSLRQYLLTNEKHPNHLLYSQIFSLFSMEIAKQNHEAATVHARTIQQLIQSTAVEGGETILPDAYLLNAILWHEQQRLLMSLRKPEFDIDGFPNASAKKQLLVNLKQELQRQGFWPYRLHCGFSGASLEPEVKAGLAELRGHWEILVALKLAGHETTEDFMSAFAHRTTSNMGKLITLYNRSKELLSTDVRSEEEIKHRAGAAACLAARYWFRCACQMELPDGGSPLVNQLGQVYGRYAMILGAVQVQCEAILQRSVTLSANDLALWLWILYVGTLAERARNNYTKYSSEVENNQFFQASFTRLAWSLNLLTWEKVEEVLSLFFYEASIGPRSAILFEEDIRKHRETTDKSSSD